jgi:hypothetical protein
LKKYRRRKSLDKFDVKPFNGDPKDLPRFVNDVEAKLDYYRTALRHDIDKILIALLLLE